MSCAIGIAICVGVGLVSFFVTVIFLYLIFTLLGLIKEEK